MHQQPVPVDGGEWRLVLVGRVMARKSCCQIPFLSLKMARQPGRVLRLSIYRPSPADVSNTCKLLTKVVGGRKVHMTFGLPNLQAETSSGSLSAAGIMTTYLTAL